MSGFELYKQQLAQNKQWEQRYEVGLDTTGITSPQGYNELPDPVPPYLLRASATNPMLAPLYTNPAAALYVSGDQNQVLLNSADPTCSTGCLDPTTKPDPRVFSIKPLYMPTVFTAPQGQQLPNPYNVTGMY